MKKTGFKTFVYSFVFSLSAILSANSVFWHARTPQYNKTKISNKNITLFLRQEGIDNNLAPLKSKKIVLSVLTDIKPEELKTEEDAIPLNADSIAENDYHKFSIAQKIPLQLSGDMQKAKNAAKKIAQSDINSDNVSEIDIDEKITLNFDNIIKSPPPIENSEYHLNLANKVKKDINQKISVARKNAKNKKVTISEDNKSTVKIAQDVNAEPEQKIVLSSADSNIAENNAQAPLLLIPLEKEQADNIKYKEITIAEKVADNQIALKAKDIPIKSMLRESASKIKDEAKRNLKWESMAEKRKNTWEVTKGIKYPKNRTVLELESYNKDKEAINKALGNTEKKQTNQDGIKLASATAKNLLIPIPEEILKEKNIIPDLDSSKKDTESEAEEEISAEATVISQKKEENTEKENIIPDTGEKKSLLDSIAKMFNSKKEVMPIGEEIESDEDRKDTLFTAFRRKNMKKRLGRILPTEIRLSFQPNRAEISGQTLKWIRAFAEKTIEEPSAGLEIRIDGTSSPLLQQRRLNLLQNILAGEGADFGKINTVFTSREPNSFIIRTIRIKNNNSESLEMRNNPYKQW